MKIDSDALAKIFTDSLRHSEGAGSDSSKSQLMSDGSIEFIGYIDIDHLVSDVIWHVENQTNPYKEKS